VHSRDFFPPTFCDKVGQKITINEFSSVNSLRVFRLENHFLKNLSVQKKIEKNSSKIFPVHSGDFFPQSAIFRAEKTLQKIYAQK